MPPQLGTWSLRVCWPALLDPRHTMGSTPRLPLVIWTSEAPHKAGLRVFGHRLFFREKRTCVYKRSRRICLLHSNFLRASVSLSINDFSTGVPQIGSALRDSDRYRLICISQIRILPATSSHSILHVRDSHHRASPLQTRPSVRLLDASCPSEARPQRLNSTTPRNSRQRRIARDGRQVSRHRHRRRRRSSAWSPTFQSSRLARNQCRSYRSVRRSEGNRKQVRLHARRHGISNDRRSCTC